MASISIKSTFTNISRLAGLVFGTLLILSLTAPVRASAEPEFKPVGGTFTGIGGIEGTTELKAGGNSVECTLATGTGTISSATLTGNVTIEFTGCTSTGSGGSNCAIKSTNASTEGTIVTNTLHGVLGLILPKGTGSGVGVLLLPVANKKFTTLTSTTCTVETTVTGNVAGEVSPVGKSQTTGKVGFQASSSTGESIKDFDLSSGGLVKPELEAFGAIASVESSGSIASSATLEVT